MSFKEGDKVIINQACSGTRVGEIYTVDSYQELIPSGGQEGGCSCPAYWELVTENNNKQSTSMNKFYRVKKDTPTMLAGCVVKKNSSGGYSPINDLFLTDAVEEGASLNYTAYNIEHATDWYERVYEINLITKTVYKLKEEAKEYFAKEQIA